jgi:glutamyl-tRNA synthetase
VAAPRLRFAPSPTGYLHVGNARALLFNWLVARQQGGEMLLRIEDTDVDRSRPELTDDILDQIRWLGLGWDGEPVHQSERLHLYAKAADALLAAGRAYWCDCTSEQVQQRAAERAGPPGYDGHCRDRGLAGGEGFALRFRVPDEGTTTFDDIVRGTVSFDNTKLEDFVLLRSSGIPTFLLANVVDDADQGITHVVRGDDHVNGTPKYLLIAQALGLATTRCSPICPSWSTSSARSCPSGATRCRSPSSARPATCPRPWSTTWRCSVGARPTASRSGPSTRSSSCSGSRTSHPRPPSSTSRSCST